MFKNLYIMNFLSTLNDNYQKMLGMLVVTMWVSGDWKPIIMSIAGAALVLPYVFLSPLANRAAQRYGKKRVIRVCKLLEMPIVGISIIGFLLKDPTIVPNQQPWFTPLAIGLIILAIFLIGVQSSMYSPAKYGLIRDIGGVDYVSKGMGGMESVSFLGMLLGTGLSAFAVEQFSPIGYSALLLIFALLGWYFSLKLKAEEVNSDKPERLNPFAYMRSAYQTAAKYPGLNAVIFVLSIFWWFATTIQLSLIVYCQEDMGLTGGLPGYILCIAAIGISVGCVLAGSIGHKHFEIGRVPIYGVVMAAGLIAIFCLNAGHYIVFTILLFIVSVAGGFFKVPMDAVIQRTVKPEELNGILAYFNQVSFLFMLAASITYYLITRILPERYVFLMVAVVILASSISLIFLYNPIKKYIFHLRKLIFREIDKRVDEIKD